MKRIIIIAVLAYLVYYLYNKKNTGTPASKKGSENNLDMIFGKLDSAIAKTVTDPSPAEPSLVDPVGTSNANIAALQVNPMKKYWDAENELRNSPAYINPIEFKMPKKGIPFSLDTISIDPLSSRQYSNPIIEERTPGLTGDTPYWMPNGQDMIYPRGLEFSIAAQYGNF